jgi:hypothetical protein
MQQGAVREYPSGFVLEIFAGIGVRYNSIDCTLTDEEASHRDLGDWTVPTNNILRKGDHLIPRFNLGIKIGFALEK